MSKNNEAQKQAMTNFDHDLLIRIDSKVEMLHSAVTAFQVGSQQDRSKLWAEKATLISVAELAAQVDHAASKDQVLDHEKRIRIIERYSWLAAGALAILQLVLKFGLR